MNNSGSIYDLQKRALNKYDNNDIQIAVNSIQRTLYVARLALDKDRYNNNAEYVRPYDSDNLYPNKILQIAKRSGTTQTASTTMADFIIGEGFEDEALNNLVINSEGETMFDVLCHTALQYAIFKGWANHYNYNILGQMAEINTIGFETVRHTADFEKFAYSIMWEEISTYNKDVVNYFKYNPEEAKNEINEIGFNDYYGQIQYYFTEQAQQYTECYFDSVLDDAQFEAESKIYKLSNIQNGYSADYVKKIPRMGKSQREQDELIDKELKMKGAANAGHSEVISMPMSIDGKGLDSKIFEAIPKNDIDKLFMNQNKETRESIYSIYNQPRILSGIAKEGGFSKDEYLDAFDYYNSYTQGFRNLISRQYGKVFESSIWSNFKDFTIKPKDFKIHRTIEQENNGNKETIITTEE